MHFEKFDSSFVSSSVFSRQSGEKNVSRYRIYLQNYKLFDTIFKNLLKETKMKQNAQRVSNINNKNFDFYFCDHCLSKNNFKLIFCGKLN